MQRDAGPCRSEYADVGEIEHGRCELREAGDVSKPNADDMIAIARLYATLERQLPQDAAAAPDVDVDLQLAPANHPGSSRPTGSAHRPEWGGRAGAERTRHAPSRRGARRDRGRLTGSEHTDYVTKRSQYADAGIPYYWVIDLEPRMFTDRISTAGGFAVKRTERSPAHSRPTCLSRHGSTSKNCAANSLTARR